jgi:hypothetical protein
VKTRIQYSPPQDASYITDSCTLLQIACFERLSDPRHVLIVPAVDHIDGMRRVDGAWWQSVIDCLIDVQKKLERAGRRGVCPVYCAQGVR